MLIPVRQARIVGHPDKNCVAVAELLADMAKEIEAEGGSTSDMAAWINLTSPSEIIVSMVRRCDVRPIVEARIVAPAPDTIAEVWRELLADLDRADPPGSIRCFLFDAEGAHSELLEAATVNAPGGVA